jgi:threonine/homoserine/homoserine lactone efflux protein
LRPSIIGRPRPLTTDLLGDTCPAVSDEPWSADVESQQLWAFVFASVVLMFLPGVDMALVTRQVVMYGRRPAFATLAGLLAGGLTHAAFATVGLSALLLASSAAYTAVKLVGAAYLVALGVHTIMTSWSRRPRGDDSASSASAVAAGQTMALPRAFLLGFLSDVTNPKVAVFFVTFLPQFVAPGPHAATYIALLGLLFNVIATTWWIGYVLLIERVAAWFRTSSARRAIERITGAVLVALGVRLAFDRR